MTGISLTNQKSLKETAKTFYICTHLPIIVLSGDGDVVHVEGALNRYDLGMLCDGFLPAMHQEQTINGHCFHATPICDKNLDLGVFIIGPYIKDPQKEKSPLYRSEDSLLLLFDLLKTINGKCGCIRTDITTINNFHVVRAITQIYTAFKEPLTVDQMANTLGISKSYFCMMFKKHTGKTFTQFLNTVRVEESKRLLNDDSLTLMDVAIAVGFNNQNYFSMTFKKITGSSPKAFSIKCNTPLAP